MTYANLSEERADHVKHLEELELFLGSRVHRGFVAARKRELFEVEQAIVSEEPIDRKTEIESFKLRGDRRTLLSLISTFEDVRENLKQRIVAIDEALKNPNAGSSDLEPQENETT